MKKGDIVLIRSSRKQPGVRRVWDPAPRRPFVCLEEYWTRWQRNGVEPVCWQVDRDSVFEYDARLAEELEAAFASGSAEPGPASRIDALWRKARPAA